MVEVYSISGVERVFDFLAIWCIDLWVNFVLFLPGRVLYYYLFCFYSMLLRWSSTSSRSFARNMCCRHRDLYTYWTHLYTVVPLQILHTAACALQLTKRIMGIMLYCLISCLSWLMPYIGRLGSWPATPRRLTYLRDCLVLYCHDQSAACQLLVLRHSLAWLSPTRILLSFDVFSCSAPASPS